MNTAIRVDASSQIGTGHFMRCLTLADALKPRQGRIRFISRHLPEPLRAMLTAQAYEFRLLDSESDSGAVDELAHASWLGVSQEVDARDSRRALADDHWDWLIVDHYGIDSRWEAALRPATTRIMVIDDIADRQHDCDILLDQNFHKPMQDRYAGKVPLHCRLLLGPRYALLRPEFRQWREQAVPRTGPVRNILVFFGGVDADNHTARAIEALASVDIGAVQVDVVIGALHARRAAIEAACRKHRFKCHVQTTRMAELMLAADIAIGAAGSASWERCCLGLPALLTSLADNQNSIACGIESLGAGRYLGAGAAVDAAVIHDAVRDMIDHPDQVHEMSEHAYTVVDGAGADRVVAELAV